MGGDGEGGEQHHYLSLILNYSSSAQCFGPTGQMNSGASVRGLDQALYVRNQVCIPLAGFCLSGLGPALPLHAHIGPQGPLLPQPNFACWNWTLCCPVCLI